MKKTYNLCKKLFLTFLFLLNSAMLMAQLSVTGIVTDVGCTGGRNGSININVSGGTAPYTINWDTTNISNGPAFAVTFAPKTAAHPYFGTGSAFGYLIDGTEGKELTLTRGVNYSFLIGTGAGHPFFVSTSPNGATLATMVNNGQSGAPTGTGTVSFTPNSTHPSLLYYACQFHLFMGYNLNIQNGWNIEDPNNLPAGIYTVTVTDANGVTTNQQFTVNESTTTVICQNGGTVNANCGCDCPPGYIGVNCEISASSIPTMTDWGLISLAFLLLSLGVFFIRNRFVG